MKPNTLGGKFVLLVVVILSITMGINAYFFALHSKTQYVERLNSEVTKLGRFIALIAPESILTGDFITLDHYMSELNQNEDIVYSVIMSLNNKNLTSYVNFENDYVKRIQSENIFEIIKQLNKNPEIDSLKIPIQFHNQQFGFVNIGFTKKSANLLLKDYLYIHLSSAATIIAFLSICIYFVFKHNTLNPIKELILGSKNIASGNLDYRINDNSNDEFSKLAHAFNQMTNSLKRSGEEKDEALRKLQETNLKLENATRAKSTFLANMSHEIRTPLTAIIGFSESLLDSELPQEERIELNKTVIKSGKHLSQIINDILDLSKIEAQKLDIEKSTFSPFSLLEDIKLISKHKAKEKGILLLVNCEFPLPETIYSDSVRIKQILLNLTSNAVKFTDHGRVEVHFRYSSENKKIYFDVVDTGVGLTKAQQSQLFQAFSQANTSTTRLYGGTGLGLYLSQLLAERLGGIITVDSVPDVGSRFTLTLNNDVIQDATIISDNQYIRDNDGVKNEIDTYPPCKGKVLLAEDNKNNQRLTTMLLRKVGLDYTVAENGKIAVEEVLNNEYDLVLMDMQMPVMNGLEATKVLREKGYQKPIVALTANAMRDDVDTYFKTGCSDFCAKPIDRANFFNLLNKYLASEENNEEGKNVHVTPIVSSLLSSEPEFEELVTQFVNDLESFLNETYQYYANHEWESLREYLHDLKSTSGNYGYMKLSQIAKDMEYKVKKEDAPNLNNDFNTIRALYGQIRAGLGLKNKDIA